MAERPSGRTRVERGIYRQPNGKLAVCARRAGRLHFRTCGGDLGAARRAREELITALEAGRVPASPRLRLDTLAGRWSARFEAMVAAGERHRRAYEAHRFHLDHDILPRLGHRRIGSLGVEDVAALIGELRAAGRGADRDDEAAPPPHHREVRRADRGALRGESCREPDGPPPVAACSQVAARASSGSRLGRSSTSATARPLSMRMKA